MDNRNVLNEYNNVHPTSDVFFTTRLTIHNNYTSLRHQT